MSGINEEREKQIQDLDSFIQMTQTRLNKVVSGLGWTLESISKETQNTVTCPFNNGHRVGEKSLEYHLEKCQWKAEGYTEHDLPLSEPCPSVNSSSAIKFDEQLQDTVLLRAREENPAMQIEINQCCPWKALSISFFMANFLNKISCAIAPAAGVADRLIPRTSDRLTSSFTSDERKAIYDYVIARTIKPDIGDDIADMNRLTQKDGDHPKISLLELLAQERNLKRRRAKHRGVHTNKKSQVEILREVINQQMEMYEEYLADSSMKSEPKSPSRSETSSLDFQSSVGRKNYQQTKHEAEWPRRSSSKHFDRTSNAQSFLPAKRSPTNDFGFDRDRKRNRSESRESGREKNHSKRRRDRSRERDNRHGEEEGRGRHRQKEEKCSSRDEVHKSGDKSERRKRHRSRDRNNKYIETSKRREKSDDKYYREQRRLETDKSRKRNH